MWAVRRLARSVRPRLGFDRFASTFIPAHLAGIPSDRPDLQRQGYMFTATQRRTAKDRLTFGVTPAGHVAYARAWRFDVRLNVIRATLPGIPRPANLQRRLHAHRDFNATVPRPTTCGSTEGGTGVLPRWGLSGLLTPLTNSLGVVTSIATNPLTFGTRSTQGQLRNLIRR